SLEDSARPTNHLQCTTSLRLSFLLRLILQPVAKWLRLRAVAGALQPALRVGSIEPAPQCRIAGVKLALRPGVDDRSRRQPIFAACQDTPKNGAVLGFRPVAVEAKFILIALLIEPHGQALGRCFKSRPGQQAPPAILVAGTTVPVHFDENVSM